MTYSDADRERWADDHWDWVEQAGSREDDEPRVFDPTEDDYDPTPEDYYDQPSQTQLFIREMASRWDDYQSPTVWPPDEDGV